MAARVAKPDQGQILAGWILAAKLPNSDFAKLRDASFSMREAQEP